MNYFNDKDREILRELAKKQVEYANSKENEIILKKDEKKLQQ